MLLYLYLQTRPFQTFLRTKIVGFMLEQMADDIRLVTITLLNCHNAHQKLTGQGCMEGRGSCGKCPDFLLRGRCHRKIRASCENTDPNFGNFFFPFPPKTSSLFAALFSYLPFSLCSIVGGRGCLSHRGTDVNFNK